MRRKAIFIGATGQNVGKTTICLGLIALLKKKFPKLGFMKPMGQQHEKIDECLLVDKDVILFKEYFHLDASYSHMSPLIFPAGFTRNYLDGLIKEDPRPKIKTAFDAISSQNDFTIVEGTGHIGVGSIINLNNAQVANLLNLEMVIILTGGIGSSFDELAINKAMCDQHNVPLRGVILNRVLEEKQEMVKEYMMKALKPLGIPLIGCIPYNQYLNTPSMGDFEQLFHTQLLSGHEHHYRHFETIRLVATSLETFRELILPGQLIVTPATREDIVYGLIENVALQHSIEHGLILTGRHPPTPALLERLKTSHIPTLYADVSTFTAMQMITSFTAKLRKEDVKKVAKAIDLVESHLNFDLLI